MLLLLVGCGDICEDLVLRQERAIAECGVEVQLDRSYGECDGQMEDILRCEARCMEEADCHSLVEGRSGDDWQIGDWGEYTVCVRYCP